MSLPSPTIAALATGGGVSAIAVIRLSGSEAFRIADDCFKGKVKLSKQEGYTIHFGRIARNGSTVDEVLVSIFRGPNSYTGEDTVEISCHGSVYIQQQILETLFDLGAVPAKAGEFTLRAFLNGKIDLSQAEAVADLISSENQASHDLALKQLRGGYSDEIRALREQLLHFTALIELELDFSTEDVEFANRHELMQLVEQVLAAVSRLRDSFTLGNALKNGIPVTIAGKPNAGKSTLLNALLNEEKAIVSPIAGTTRDAIEDEINIDGIAYRFIDTAGLRQTEDLVENIGIERSYEKIRQAQIILYLFDAADPIEDVQNEIETLRKEAGPDKMIIPVANKSDLLSTQLSDTTNSNLPLQPVYISALQRQGIDELLARLKAWVEQQGGVSGNTIVSNARHATALQKASNFLQQVLTGLHSGLPGDLLAMDLRAALSALAEITGEVDNEEVLGAIFGKFCIGK